MLDRAHRLTHPSDFTRVSRRGRRQAGTFVVCHSIQLTGGSLVQAPQGLNVVARFGFVCSKAVGSAPTRNRVRRQLRAIAREVMADPLGDVVIRALPGAASAGWNDLRSEVRRLLGVTPA